jgi:hypothetical protein
VALSTSTAPSDGSSPALSGRALILRWAADVGHDLVVRATPIDPRDQRRESDSPAYRVYFWQSVGSGEGSGWQSEEWELTEADVDEVLAWADAQAGGRTMSVWVVVHRDAGGVGLIRLAGIDPTADPGAWPSWASPRSG